MKRKEVRVNKAPGFKSKPKADLFIITEDNKRIWVEVQTTLTRKEIESKIKKAVSISDNELYNEFVLIFPEDFLKTSLFMSTYLIITGNPYTNKLRVLVYKNGTFETIIEPGERGDNIFGRSL